jgi:hypothetical protein
VREEHNVESDLKESEDLSHGLLWMQHACIWMLKGRHFVMSHRRKWDTSVVSFISALVETLRRTVGHAFTKRVYVVTELIFLTRNILLELFQRKFGQKISLVMHIFLIKI